MESRELQVGRLSSRVLSREDASGTNVSSRVYYRDFSGAIPFVWETRPGTPKNMSAAPSPIPVPLTPPPSFNSRSNVRAKRSRMGCFGEMGLWAFRKPAHGPAESPSSSSVSSSSTHSPTSWWAPGSKKGSLGSLSFDSERDEKKMRSSKGTFFAIGNPNSVNWELDV